ALNLGFTSTEQALKGTALTEQLLLNQETFDLADAIQVVQNIKDHSDNANWAAIFGGHLGIATHGPVGYAAVSAPTVGKALATFIDWFYIRCDCYQSKVSERDDVFEIEIIDTTGDQTFKTFFFEAFSRAFEVLLGLLIGNQSQQATRLSFQAKALDRKHLMSALYTSELAFDQTVNRITVAKSIWYLPSPLSDRDSHQLNLQKCQQLLDNIEQQQRIDLAVKNIIRNSIEARLLNQQNSASLESLTNVSQQLHMSERTLVRKLNKLGTSFKQILESQRKLFADKLLMNVSYSIADVAYLLGYKESASFCRAFKQWYGLSPTSYRRNPNLSKQSALRRKSQLIKKAAKATFTDE
ncbi:MAG: helix-turn-helix domain-containing protein, partial [Kangiellaceae bacterium]|nr:helix-turn-helix domain-containing protein [Kangiellaceae bacterium]